MQNDREFSWIWSAIYWITQAVNMFLGGVVMSVTWNDFYAEPFGLAYRVGIAHAIGLTAGLRIALGVLRDTPANNDEGMETSAKRAVTTAVAFVITLVIMAFAKLAM